MENNDIYAVILTLVASCLVLGYAIWQYALCPSLKKPGKGDNNALYIIGVMLAAFTARIICAAVFPGHKTDMNCFNGWSARIFNEGIGKFYEGDNFHDYPPGYMYVLYIIGAFRRVFNATGGGLNVLIRFPAIVCDMLTGWLIYRIADKKLGNGRAAAISAFYLINPAVIMNSAVWGQVDSVYTLFAALMIWLISEKQMVKAYFAFAICIFIKPQAFIFTPLVIYGIIENVFLPRFNREKFVKNLLWGFGAIAMMVLLALPFGIGNVYNQYKETLNSYPYLTVNAFNIWGAFGQNWTKIEDAPIAGHFGYVMLALIVAASAFIFFRSRHKSKYYFTGAFLSMATYMLSTRMHDRYAFSVMVLLLLAFIETRDIRSYALYFLSMAAQFFNVAWVLFIYEQNINLYFKSPVIVTASFVNIAIFAYMIYLAASQYVGNDIRTVEPPKTVASAKKRGKQGKAAQPASRKSDADTRGTKGDRLIRSAAPVRMTKKDFIIMAVITVVYGILTMYNLGDMQAPQTEVSIAKNAVTVDMGKDVKIDKLKFFNGSWQLESNRSLTFEYTNDAGQQVKSDTYDKGAVFYWSEKNVNTTARYIKISTNATATQTEDLCLKEVCFLDGDGNVLRPENAQDLSVAAVFDEQELCPERTTNMNSTYFDEIYHARTAYEFIHHLPVYEWTHPPLGKLIIALGIMIFGMVPFGWRVAGAFVGILMVPLIFIFSKKMFKRTWIAAATCLFLTFDFMHFAQTRIATIDVYVTFFIMLMYLFMYKYYTMSFYDTEFKKTLIPLLLSGISMGLGVSAKWTGAYAGAGLAVIFFYTVLIRYNEYRTALKNRSGSSNGIPNKQIIEEFRPKLIKTLGWCILFFVVIPIVIYYLSYIPYMMTPSGKGLETITMNMDSMYTYHAKTVLSSTHSFSSEWYRWPIMARPVWFYSGTTADDLKEGISTFGNPAVWWTGIAALIYMIYLAAAKKDKTALFLLIAYFAQLVPWMGVKRMTFIYHYFPCVPFMVLMLGYSLKDIYESAKNKKAVFIGAAVFTAVVIGLFIWFYPAISGAPRSIEFFKTLRWFDSWQLISW